MMYAGNGELPLDWDPFGSPLCCLDLCAASSMAFTEYDCSRHNREAIEHSLCGCHRISPMSIDYSSDARLDWLIEIYLFAGYKTLVVWQGFTCNYGIIGSIAGGCPIYHRFGQTYS